MTRVPLGCNCTEGWEAYVVVRMSVRAPTKYALIVHLTTDHSPSPIIITPSDLKLCEGWPLRIKLCTSLFSTWGNPTPVTSLSLCTSIMQCCAAAVYGELVKYLNYIWAG
jgi:hypothetical protein